MDRLTRLRALCGNHPRDPFAWYSLAMELRSVAPSEALETFARVHRDHPDYLPNYYQWAAHSIGQGAPEAAREIIRDGIALAKRQSDAHTASELTALAETLG